MPYFDDKPVRYEIRYLRNDLCGGILRENLALESIHEILVFKYNLPLTKVWQRMEAVSLSEEVAFLFNVNPGGTPLFISSVSHTPSRMPSPGWNISSAEKLPSRTASTRSIRNKAHSPLPINPKEMQHADQRCG
jgi:hypothetical protein